MTSDSLKDKAEQAAHELKKKAGAGPSEGATEKLKAEIHETGAAVQDAKRKIAEGKEEGRINAERKNRP